MLKPVQHSAMSEGELIAFQRGVRHGIAMGMDRDQTYSFDEIVKVAGVTLLTGFVIGLGIGLLVMG